MTRKERVKTTIMIDAGTLCHVKKEAADAQRRPNDLINEILANRYVVATPATRRPGRKAKAG